MIVEFSVKNFRSIKDLQTISFRATKLDSNSEKHPDVDGNNVVEVGGMRLLKTVGIYGANASGKSNVIEALKMFHIALFPAYPLLSAPGIFDPFLFQEDANNSEVFFQIVVLIKNKKYRYGFTVKGENRKSVITNEWLYGVKQKNQGKYFIREGMKIDKEKLPDGNRIPDIPYPYTLFLTHAASFDKGICAAIWHFINKIDLPNSNSPYIYHTIELLENEVNKNKVLGFLNAFNLNYSDVNIFRHPKDRGEYEVDFIKHSKTLNLRQHESEGTKKLFRLVGFLINIFNAPEGQSGAIVLDEIDSNFHPALVIKLIQMFNDPEINKSNAQLLFTSHDTNLLAPAIMRRDQFYFTEKDEQDATRLYSLADLKGIRNDADFARQYLAGYYGAVPVLKDFKNETVAEDV